MLRLRAQTPAAAAGVVLLSQPPYAVYVLTRQGYELARRLSVSLPVRLYAASSLQPSITDSVSTDVVWFERLSILLRETFGSHACHIFVAAAGIAVRAVAPLLSSKATDPAVLSVDHRGTFVISLLSGHLGGGNAEARRIAGILGATPVITTATDLEALPAIDLLAKEKGLVIANLGAAKHVSAALLAAATVFLDDPADHLGLKGSPWESLFCPLPRQGDAPFSPESPDAAILVTPYQPSPADVLPGRSLILHPPVLHVGIGCRRGAAYSAVFDAVKRVFADNRLSLSSVAALASHEVKADESGIIALAEKLRAPFHTFAANILAAYPVTRPSPKARERFGIDGVCEPAALASARLGSASASSVLLVPKQVVQGITIAVACRGSFSPLFSSFAQNIS